MDTNVLYITYDGLLDPLGQSQVLPYIRELGRLGTKIRVISFEKPEFAAGEAVEQLRKILDDAGVRWYPLRYHRHPTVPATLWDIWRGVSLARKLACGEPPAIIHARSYIAGLIALMLKRKTDVKFLFDMRGFWPDERVEGGSWKRGGLLYLTFKLVEKILLGAADGIVSLTRRGADIIEKDMLPKVRKDLPPLAVIPTCADLELFSPAVNKEPWRGGPVRVLYLGSLGSWYMLEPMLAFFAVLRQQAPGSTLRILTGSDRSIMERAADKLQLDKDVREAISLGQVPRRKVPEEFNAADCSIFFIQPSFSKRASCATKFAESIACGVPVVINSGVGDHDSHVRGRGIGVVLDSLDEKSYSTAVDKLKVLLADKETPLRCRSVAETGFSLTGAVEKYGELYGRMTSGGQA